MARVNELGERTPAGPTFPFGPPQAPTPTPTPTPAPKPPATPTPSRGDRLFGLRPPTVAPKEFGPQQAPPALFGLRSPTLPTFEFQPWKPPPIDDPELREQFTNFVDMWQGSGQLTSIEDTGLGQRSNIMDAYLSVFAVGKNVEVLLPQVKEFDPQGFHGLVRADAQSGLVSASLHPLIALNDALADIKEEHPEDLIAHLSSDEGRADLMARAATYVLSPNQKRAFSILTPGEGAAAVVRDQLPEGPLTDILATTLEIVGDPIFLASLVIFPPAGLAAKARLGMAIAVGAAAGEEVAEEIGIPEIVGSLTGAVVLPTATGFARAGLRAGLRTALENPENGSIAAQYLKSIGRSITGLEEVSAGLNLPSRTIRLAEKAQQTAQATGKGKVLYHGTGDKFSVFDEGFLDTTALFGPGVYLTDSAEVAAGYAVRRARKATASFQNAVRDEQGIFRTVENEANVGLIRLTGKEVLIDLEQALPEKAIKALEKQAARFKGAFEKGFGGLGEEELTAYEAAVVAARGGKPGRDVYKAFTDELSTGFVPLGEAGEILEGLNLALQDAGFDGMTHLGGKITGGKPHNVTIIFDPKKAPLQQMVGGSAEINLELMDDAIQALIERPEAQDLLRKIVTGASERAPGIKLLVNPINRTAIATEPQIRGAFGYTVLKNIQEAKRIVSLAPIKGRGNHFLEDGVGRIWVPEKAGQRGSILGLFGKGKGEWIAGGDVFESIQAGGSKYLDRLSAKQLRQVRETNAVHARKTKAAETATGLEIAKREFHWPRFVQDEGTGFYAIRPGAGKTPSSLFRRVIEVQNEAIADKGISYKPGFFFQSETYLAGMDRLIRDAVLVKFLKREGVITRLLEEQTSVPKGTRVASAFGPTVKLRETIPDVVEQEIMSIIGPGTRDPVLGTINKINAIFRLSLTGTMDNGVGSLQLVTLFFSPAGPKAWAEAMGRGFLDAMTDPNNINRYIARNPAARQGAEYGVDISTTSEFTEAITQSLLPRVPVVTPILGALTAIPRLAIRRVGVAFNNTLTYGRILLNDALSEAVARPKLFARLMGAPARLEGEALHHELFRVARFTETLLGQPRLTGIVKPTQLQAESGFLWFAARYTRSFLGTLSYLVGSGATPAQARVTMAKMLLGGASIMSGLIAARGLAVGKSEEEILEEIQTALNPLNGKKFMSMKIGEDWYGLGGVFRSGFAAFSGLANKDNWDFENWENPLWDNPIIRMWRSRTSPFTGRFMDFLDGEDFLGYSVDYKEFTNIENGTLANYLLTSAAPITLDALLQNPSWQRSLPRFTAEFFGLRTSPETAFEALQPVMDRVSQQEFGIDFKDLKWNMPAQDFVRNHPDVIAVVEGQVRPHRDRPAQRLMNEWVETRDEKRQEAFTDKENLDDTFRTGRIDGATYRDLYGDVSAREFFEIQQMTETLGLDFGDEEPPEGTVDWTLDQYFAIDVDDYRDPDTLQVDWEGLFSDREQVLSQVSDENLFYVERWLKKNETELRREMRQTFERIIEPSGYFETRDTVAAILGINLDTLRGAIVRALEGEKRRAASNDVNREVDRILNATIKAEFGDNAPGLTKIRQTIREVNPFLDAELFRQGLVSTVRSEAAIEVLRRAMELNPDRGYFLAPLSTDVKEALERERRK